MQVVALHFLAVIQKFDFKKGINLGIPILSRLTEIPEVRVNFDEK